MKTYPDSVLSVGGSFATVVVKWREHFLRDQIDNLGRD